uniref:Uncharacterized protein n=1 Tax=Trichogramma kaykai TaxID=54128 RepID=A0ABD2XJK1_9HYME
MKANLDRPNLNSHHISLFSIFKKLKSLFMRFRVKDLLFEFNMKRLPRSMFFIFGSVHYIILNFFFSLESLQKPSFGVPIESCSIYFLI